MSVTIGARLAAASAGSAISQGGGIIRDGLNHYYEMARRDKQHAIDKVKFQDAIADRKAAGINPAALGASRDAPTISSGSQSPPVASIGEPVGSDANSARRAMASKDVKGFARELKRAQSKSARVAVASLKGG